MTPEALTTEFESLRKPLESAILRMTAGIQDTEDIVQDAYLENPEGEVK